MTYYGAKELADSFRTVRKNTITIAEEIPEDRYSFRPAPDARTVAQTLIHMADATKLPAHIHGTLKLKTLEGFDFFGFFGAMMAEQENPPGKAEILKRLNEHGNRFADWMGSLSESFLAERVSFPAGMTPPDKTRFEMLLGPKEHEMHHRAQLMVIQRMLGIVPHLTRQMNERMAAMTAAQKKTSA